jgi:class 3 adenylate cyclase
VPYHADFPDDPLLREAARVESAARGGTLLATKALLERLDAAELGIDPHAGSYTLLGDLPDASEKARRDAGSLSVRVLAS